MAHFARNQAHESRERENCWPPPKAFPSIGRLAFIGLETAGKFIRGCARRLMVGLVGLNGVAANKSKCLPLQLHCSYLDSQSTVRKPLFAAETHRTRPTSFAYLADEVAQFKRPTRGQRRDKRRVPFFFFFSSAGLADWLAGWLASSPVARDPN